MTTVIGINDELAPWLRMTSTRGLRENGLAEVRVGTRSCVLTDQISYDPRLPLPDALLRSVYAAIFRHRHKRLRRHFGGHPIA